MLQRHWTDLDDFPFNSSSNSCSKTYAIILVNLLLLSLQIFQPPPIDSSFSSKILPPPLLILQALYRLRFIPPSGTAHPTKLLPFITYTQMFFNHPQAVKSSIPLNNFLYSIVPRRYYFKIILQKYVIPKREYPGRDNKKDTAKPI